MVVIEMMVDFAQIAEIAFIVSMDKIIVLNNILVDDENMDFSSEIHMMHDAIFDININILINLSTLTITYTCVS